MKILIILYSLSGALSQNARPGILLVDSREIYVAPRSVDEAIAFAKSIRERDRDSKKTGTRAPINHSSTLQETDELPDDAVSSIASESEGDSDQVRSDWILRKF